MRISIYSFLLLTVSLVGCGEEKKTDNSKQLEGFRYNVTLTRAIDSVEWVETGGQHEWWFFTGGVFKQISSDYVEPQYYGPSQACNGSASGSYTMVDAGSERKKTVTLTYDGARDVNGLCRMTDRTLNVILQPSGNLDVVDGQIVQRAGRLEQLY